MNLARIIGGIDTPHSPTIGFAMDTKKQKDLAWAPIFEGYEPIQQWISEKNPDVLFIIYNDHITSFFFDHSSAFALGVDDVYKRPTRAVVRASCQRLRDTLNCLVISLLP